MKLDDILDCFFNSQKGDSLGSEPGWPEAQGPSYHEVLGQPNPSNPLPPNVGNMAPQPGMGAPWQQQQQPIGQAPPGAPVQGGAGAAPQMMPQQNFMVPQTGPNMNQGQGQMFQPMYQGPGGGQMPAQRPQNANNMPPQDQQAMAFNQQSMMAPQPGAPGPQQGMAVPSGMVNPQGGPIQGGMMMMPGGQPMQGQAMPKFQGMQMVMMQPPGHYQQQQFQQQGQPGQPGPQPGGPPGGPQNPQGHWQQNQMMPVQMMQGGPRGPPHPMGGHDG